MEEYKHNDSLDNIESQNNALNQKNYSRDNSNILVNSNINSNDRNNDINNNFEQFNRNNGQKQQQWKRKKQELSDGVSEAGRSERSNTRRIVILVLKPKPTETIDFKFKKILGR